MGTQSRPDVRVIGQRLSDRRAHLRLEQSQVAERAGLSRAYISRLESGSVTNPKVFDLARVADALEMPLPVLLAPDDAQRLIETRFSHEWEEIQRQTEGLPDEIRERTLRGFRESLAVLQAASDLARRN